MRLLQGTCETWVSGKSEFYNESSVSLDVATGIGHTPAAIGHLGEGTGRFSADPSWRNASGVVSDVLTAGAGLSATGAALPSINGSKAAIATKKPDVKYIGKLDDLKGIPRSQTLLDDLPNLGSPKANYYQNSSVLRKALRDGYEIRDASAYRPNSSHILLCYALIGHWGKVFWVQSATSWIIRASCCIPAGSMFLSEINEYNHTDRI